jgi:ribose-phosphate pyrophosphokinase
MQDLSREVPYGELAIIGTRGTEAMLERIEKYIGEWRKEDGNYIIKASFPRFGTGEGKCLISESVRGKDVFIVADCYNYNVTYKMRGMDIPTTPDEHFCDLKRIISAIGGKAKRISVVMPMLYSSRQHRVGGRESLDCAQSLADLASMGVDNIMTFDAHDDRVRNAIPLKGFDNLMPTYQMLKSFFRHESNIDKNNLMIVSPDEGALARGMYYSTMLGTQLSMFYKKRDYSVVKDGRNPISSHEYLGDDVNGKDLIVVDDIASSGESFLKILDKLKSRGAKRIFGFFTFGLFCNGLEVMDKYYAEGMFDKVYTTNTIYNSPELLSRDWFVEVNLLKYIAYYIEAVNINRSISTIIDPFEKINTLLAGLENHNF